MGLKHQSRKQTKLNVYYMLVNAKLKKKCRKAEWKYWGGRHRNLDGMTKEDFTQKVNSG